MYLKTLTGLLLMLSQVSFGQYYYKHLLNADQSRKQYALLMQHGIRQVNVEAREPDGSPSPEFLLRQEIDRQRKTVTTFARTSVTGSSIMVTAYNDAGLPLSVVDSTTSSTTRTQYEWDAQGRLVRLSSQSSTPEQKDYVTTEEHVYEYDANGQPTRMWRIVDRSDSTEVRFIPAENGMPGEEQWWRGGRKTETWFYYYDPQKRLTDIVRYNARARRMLPDHLFEYDEAGRVARQVNVQGGTGQYRLWQYQYDARGLKVGERVQNKQRQIEGRLVYQYQ